MLPSVSGSKETHYLVLALIDMFFIGNNTDTNQGFCFPCKIQAAFFKMERY